VEESAMQGQTFTGEQALAVGLVDGLVDSLQDVVDMAR
jgi:enoyl-CoA hydratase/carnithine racemase